jgi:hypothetical protein
MGTPLWFREDGALIHLPDPDGQAPGSSLPLWTYSAAALGDGIETTWQATGNAGANPVSSQLHQADRAKPVVHELLHATFGISITKPSLGRKDHTRRRQTPKAALAD